MVSVVRQTMVIRLEAFDHRLLDQAVMEIVHSVHITGAKIRGPIPLPRRIQSFTVNRSPHIDKESREQFEIRNHYRVIYIEPHPQTIDALKKLELTSGVNVKIKIKNGDKI